jgi:hypothetical protein
LIGPGDVLLTGPGMLMWPRSDAVIHDGQHHQRSCFLFGFFLSGVGVCCWWAGINRPPGRAQSPEPRAEPVNYVRRLVGRERLRRWGSGVIADRGSLTSNQSVDRRHGLGGRWAMAAGHCRQVPPDLAGALPTGTSFDLIGGQQGCMGG